MSSTLYDPINVYKPLATDIGIVDGPFEYFSVAGIRMPMPFSTRMTVVRLGNGDLFLHSPVKYDENLAAELRSLGTIRHLISPNQWHYAQREFRGPYTARCDHCGPQRSGEPAHLSINHLQ